MVRSGKILCSGSSAGRDTPVSELDMIRPSGWPRSRPGWVCVLRPSAATIALGLVLVGPAADALAEEACPFGRHPLGYCLDTPTVKGRIRKAPQRLLLESSPPGASVYIDGQLLSDGGISLITPQQLGGRHLPKGMTVVEFEMPGFRRQSRRVAVQPHGLQRVCALLEPVHTVSLRPNVDCLLKKEVRKSENSAPTSSATAAGDDPALESPSPFMELYAQRTGQMLLDPGDYRFVCSAKNFSDAVVELSIPARRSPDPTRTDCEILDAESKEAAEAQIPGVKAELALQQLTLTPIPADVDIESDIANVSLVFSKLASAEASCPPPSDSDTRITITRKKSKLRLNDGVGWYCVNVEYQYQPSQASLFNGEQLDILKSDLKLATVSGRRVTDGILSSILSRRIFVPNDGYTVSMLWREAAANHNQLVDTNIITPKTDDFRSQVRSCWETRPKECRLASCWDKGGKGCDLPSCWKVDVSTCHKAAAVVLLSRARPALYGSGTDYRQIAAKLVADNMDKIRQVRGGLQENDFRALQGLGVEGILFAASCRRGIGVACETLGALLLERQEPRQALPFFQLACLQGSESACLRAIDPGGWPAAAELFELIESKNPAEADGTKAWGRETSIKDRAWSLDLNLAGIPSPSFDNNPLLATFGILGAADYENGRWFSVALRVLSPLLLRYRQTAEQVRYVFGLEAARAEVRWHPRGGRFYVDTGGAVELRCYDTGTERPALLFNGWQAGMGLFIRRWRIAAGLRAESVSTRAGLDRDGSAVFTNDWHLLPFLAIESGRFWEE